jgi:alkanesulfonate monooxygenase SsuD/methylene tetrahydromethanopterin reductase-like flavin-dependent oxidoreductase (luciferase family)
VARRHWETIEQITLADKLGFESAWLAESVFFPGRPMSNPLMVASAAAQHTSQIRFGTLAAQFPLHHPIHMATQAATCDILTNGRLDLCLGGRWGAPAGQAFGQAADISSEESRGRVAEGIGLLKAAWTQERANFKGEYWDMDDLLVMPKPVQQPHPPLLIAANSDETFPYAASMGLGVIGTTLSQPMPRMIDRLRDFENAKNTESSSHPQPFHVNISFFVAETREKAHKLMGRNWRDEDIVNTVPDATASSIGTSRHSFTSGVGGWATWSFQDALKYSIYDDPDGCVEQLRNLGKDLSGMAQCILEFNRRGRLTNEEVKESMQLFGEAVMPQLA